MAVKKRKRKTKTSAGINGGGGKLRPRMNEVDKVLLGKGMWRTFKPIGTIR